MSARLAILAVLAGVACGPTEAPPAVAPRARPAPDPTPTPEAKDLIGELGAGLSIFVHLPDDRAAAEIEARLEAMAQSVLSPLDVERRDGSFAVARGLVGPGLIIGWGPENDPFLEQARVAVPADFAAESTAMVNALERDLAAALARIRGAVKVAYVYDNGVDPDASPGQRLATADELHGLMLAHRFVFVEIDRVSDLEEEADLLVVLAPGVAFDRHDLAEIRDHQRRGGTMLIGLDRATGVGLGALGPHLGLRFDLAGVTDDKEYMKRRGIPSDRRLILTNRFADHPVTAPVRDINKSSGILLINTGSLVPVAGAVPPQLVVHTMPSSFRDLDDDFAFDQATEAHAVVAAIEADTRSVVFADWHMLSDPMLSQVPKAKVLASGVLRWLGGRPRAKRSP